MSKERVQINNLNDVKRVLSGDFVNVQIGYGSNEKDIQRKIGETWVGLDGIEWEQMNGYKSKVTKLDYIREEINKYNSCPMEICNVNQYNETRLDKKFRNLMGMCGKCVAKLETKIRVDGNWEEYEKNKVKQNAISYLKDKQTELQDMVNALENFSTIRENGTVDKWSKLDPEQVKKDIIDDFERYKSEVKKQYNITDEEVM